MSQVPVNDPNSWGMLSPDGKLIVRMASSIRQLYVFEHLTNKFIKTIDRDKPILISSLRWSPDSKHLGFTDVAEQLFLWNAENQCLVKVEHFGKEDGYLQFINHRISTEFGWPPDSGQLVIIAGMTRRLLLIPMRDVGKPNPTFASVDLVGIPDGFSFHPPF